jgi:hypothetical protein
MMPSLFRFIVLTVVIALPLRAAPPQQLWLYVSQNLAVDKNVDELVTLLTRASKVGYTHVLLADAKFSRLDEMGAGYFRNVERVKKVAAENHLEVVPALFSVGYSNDLLSKDPNLVEGLPVRDALFVVKGGEARVEAEKPVTLKGGGFSDLKRWDWVDKTVAADNGSALIRDPRGENARISQKLTLTPFRQYHMSVRVKTADFRGTPEVKLLAGKLSLNHRDLKVKPTQDWNTHHVVFNSLSNTSVQLYLGCWGGKSGSLWFDDLTIEEVGLVNVIRRPGAPLVVKTEVGQVLKEGEDFERVTDPLMGTKPWKGEYDVYHAPPGIKTSLPDGTRLRVSYFHAATVHDGQAMICPSEPRTVELLRKQAQQMHKTWGAKGYMMSHDEIRVLNWCDACQKRNMDAGAILADNVRTCTKILREVNPGGRIYVWSDMFDPHHNAHKDYYLVRGDLAGSWEGLDKEVTIIPWYFEKRAESLKFFADRGHRQVIAGYYDHKPAQIRDWISAAEAYPGVEGVMYTTWVRNFKDMETFAVEARKKTN